MKYAIGIDMGGTKIEGVLVSERGKIQKKLRMPTDADKSRSTTINNIITVINSVHTKKIIGIGIFISIIIAILKQVLNVHYILELSILLPIAGIIYLFFIYFLKLITIKEIKGFIRDFKK